ncbi:MAG TPA: DUF4410 domain-containing protein [Thermoanaerobaculia bacterium]|nr:DUF4410 domain-containing protein [Thermoanaerobaculia bacterium]
MKRRASRGLLSAFSLILLAALALPASLVGSDAALDKGLLVPSWFGAVGQFRESDEIDYLWVKEGFEIDGHTFHFVDWPEPDFQGSEAGDRDENDRRLARQMNAEMARTFHDVLGRALAGRAMTSMTAGDVRVQGRIVDCSTGSTAAKMLVGFGAGSGNTTIDLKLTDAATGELLAALHHRVLSGTSWSTTDSKFVKWVEKLGRDVGKKGLQETYRKAKPVKS